MNDPIAALQAKCEIELALVCASMGLGETEKEAYRLGFIAGALFGMAAAKAVYTEEA